MAAITSTSTSTSASTRTDWDLVVACLHHTGDLRTGLCISDEILVRRQADGLGERLKPAHGLMDWSHVRDSSDGAIARMAQLLRACGKQ